MLSLQPLDEEERPSNPTLRQNQNRRRMGHPFVLLHRQRRATRPITTRVQGLHGFELPLLTRQVSGHGFTRETSQIRCSRFSRWMRRRDPRIPPFAKTKIGEGWGTLFVLLRRQRRATCPITTRVQGLHGLELPLLTRQVSGHGFTRETSQIRCSRFSRWMRRRDPRIPPFAKTKIGEGWGTLLYCCAGKGGPPAHGLFLLDS